MDVISEQRDTWQLLLLFCLGVNWLPWLEDILNWHKSISMLQCFTSKNNNYSDNSGLKILKISRPKNFEYFVILIHFSLIFQGYYTPSSYFWPGTPFSFLLLDLDFTFCCTRTMMLILKKTTSFSILWATVLSKHSLCLLENWNLVICPLILDLAMSTYCALFSS